MIPWSSRAPPTFRTDAFIDGAFRPALAARGSPPRTRRPATLRRSPPATPGTSTSRSGRRPAFDDGRWSRRSPADRKAVLLRFADLLEANLEELAMLDSLEAGKPITDCREVDVPDDDQDVPLVRRGDRQGLRRGRADRPGRARADRPRADRRRRRGRALELPAPDGGLEARPRRSRPATA